MGSFIQLLREKEKYNITFREATHRNKLHLKLNQVCQAPILFSFYRLKLFNTVLVTQTFFFAAD